MYRITTLLGKIPHHHPHHPSIYLSASSQGVLTEYIETLDCSIEDFYREVRDSGVTSDDPYLQKFVECLLASAGEPY